MLEVPPVGCVASLLVVHTNLVYCYTTLASLGTSPLYATLVLYKEENTITLSLLIFQELSFIKRHHFHKAKGCGYLWYPDVVSFLDPNNLIVDHFKYFVWRRRVW